VCKDKNGLVGDEAVVAAQVALADGNIVAVKGLGGFHFACDATDDLALKTLRDRKGRVDKPFAIMARDLETISTFAYFNEQEASLLTSRQRPIVLLRKRLDTRLSDLVAPGNNFVGVMLPYTPLHVLLFDALPFEDGVTQSVHAAAASSNRSCHDLGQPLQRTHRPQK
jgi:hydrogenase maturation protein HypF